MATQGFITLPAGIALAFGANVGTCVTALLASIGKPREAVRAGMVHILFNVAGVLVWVGFIDQLAAFVTWLSPVSEGLTGTDKLAAEAPRQIANAHTVFNIANTVIFIGFTGVFARIVEKLVPDKPMEEGVIVRAKYLDKELLTTPALALERTRLEIGHMGERVKAMLDGMMPTILTGDRDSLKEIAKMDDEVDILHGHIIEYLSQISRQGLSDRESHEFLNLMDAVNDLENIGDIIETDLVTLGEKRVDKNVTVSEKTQKVLMDIHTQVAQTVTMAMQAVMNNDQKAGQEVIALKGSINQLIDAAEAHQAERLIANEPNRLRTYSIEVDIIEKMKRIYYFAKRMAKAVVPLELQAKAAE